MTTITEDQMVEEIDDRQPPRTGRVEAAYAIDGKSFLRIRVREQRHEDDYTVTDFAQAWRPISEPRRRHNDGTLCGGLDH